MEERKEQTIGMVRLHFHIQYTWNSADNISFVLPKEE
jgi:hypothetical protein